MRTARDNVTSTEAPLSHKLALQATTTANAVILSWRPVTVPGSTRVRYLVYRSANGDGCISPTEGANECYLTGKRIGTTGEQRFVDRPPSGRHAYRVAMVTDYVDSPTATDLMLVSEPAFATTR
jgi:hypothetical protein